MTKGHVLDGMAHDVIVSWGEKEKEKMVSAWEGDLTAAGAPSPVDLPDATFLA